MSKRATKLKFQKDLICGLIRSLERTEREGGLSRYQKSRLTKTVNTLESAVKRSKRAKKVSVPERTVMHALQLIGLLFSDLFQ